MRPQPTQRASSRPNAKSVPKDNELPPFPSDAEQALKSSSNGLFKRFTTKLRSPILPSQDPSSSSTPTPPKPHTSPTVPASSTPQDKPTFDGGKVKRKATLRLPSMPKPPQGTALNSFTSVESRQAALRARGLLPSVPHPYKDSHGYMIPLSEQERVLDSRFTVLTKQPDPSGDESEAKRIKEAWLARNATIQTAAVPDPAPRTDIKQQAAQAHVKAAALPAIPEKQPADHGRGEPADIGRCTSPVSVSIPSSHSAPVVPRKDRLISPSSSPPGDAKERVSRWLQTSSGVPTTPNMSPACSPAIPNSPDATVVDMSSPKELKGTPMPIMVTITPSSSTPSTVAVSPPIAPAFNKTSMQSQDTLTPPFRGRSVTASYNSREGPQVDIALDGLGISSISSTNCPALSPTRTTSSSTASLSVGTPTTVSHSHSVESQGLRARPRRSTTNTSEASESLRPGKVMGSAIPENCNEDRSSSIAGSGLDDFGVAAANARELAAKRSATMGLFTRNSDDSTRSPRSSSSMLNLRRSVASKLQIRPRSTVSPPSAFSPPLKANSPAHSDRMSLASSQSHSSTSSARKALSPTMHNHQTIAFQAALIEDEESRRLSEMAFMDY